MLFVSASLKLLVLTYVFPMAKGCKHLHYLRTIDRYAWQRNDGTTLELLTGMHGKEMMANICTTLEPLTGMHGKEMMANVCTTLELLTGMHGKKNDGKHLHYLRTIDRYEWQKKRWQTSALP